MEKLYFDNGKGVKLCGILDMPTPNAPIVIIAHGFTSHKASSRNTALAQALNRQGIGTFRFDFYAHGESQGTFEDITLREGVDDVIAAYNHVRLRFSRHRIALFGSSFGGAACFYALPHLHVEGAALKAPAILYKKHQDQTHGPEGIRKWRELGYQQYTNYEGKKFRLKYTFYESLKEFDGRGTARRITVPVLILHGDKDEIIPHQDSVEIVKHIPEGRLSTFPGANHVFTDAMDHARLVHQAVEFFQEIFALDTHAQRL
jgi:uncharacterized protein